MGSDSDVDDFSDNEIDDKSHNKLLQGVSSLGKAQYVQKATRTEPTTKISEYNLVKSVTGASGKINIDELTKTLADRAKHANIQKKLQKVTNNSTLAKPLEKPEAQKIRRAVGFTKAKEQLSRWDAVVTKNRISDNLKFPLPKGSFDPNPKTPEDLVAGFHLKSELQLIKEKLTPKVEVYEIEDEYPLNLEEIMERRKEMAKLRAHQSYIEAKAKRQGKIKSKKFHRVLKRAKMKQQLKEFEELQKTNPEEALKKLDEIETARAEERVSLRHKSTGKWAKSKLVRAKYDKETRQVLAQQLAISKELTQKVNVENSSDSELENETPVSHSKAENINNPWVKNSVKTSTEIDNFVSGYRKFWDDKNKLKNDGSDSKEKHIVKSEIETNVEDEEPEENIAVDTTMKKNIVENGHSIKKQQANKSAQKKGKRVDEKDFNSSQNEVTTKKNKRSKTLSAMEEAQEKQQKGSKPAKKQQKKQTKSGGFVVEEDVEDKRLAVTKSMALDAIFDGVTKKIKEKLSKKIKTLKHKLSQENPKAGTTAAKKKRKPKQNRYDSTDLSFPTQAKRPVIDEELLTGNEDADSQKIAEFNKMVSLLSKQPPNEKRVAEPSKAAEDIDPNKFLKPKSSELNTELPDLVNVDDENNDDREDDDDDDEQRQMISAAFEDDDVVDEFTRDKKLDVDKDKVAEVDLFLPGWGNWGGKNVETSTRRRKRFIVKFPEKEKRKDQNKGELIVNENATKKAKEHLVSELPFPFKTVRDYEASIRAPIGNTFVTEMAYRKFIKPAVRTRMGTVIEPMDEDQLMSRKKPSGKIKR